MTATIARPSVPCSRLSAGNRFRKFQRGVTLMELMVGSAIGLLVVAVVMGDLLVSRSISGTVSDVTGIQQQAAHAMRIIGQQVRQAGSLKLNLDATAADDTLPADVLAPVAFETTAPASGASLSFNPATDTLSGVDTPNVTLTTGSRRYAEDLTGSAAAAFQMRNCLGGPIDSSPDQLLQSTFTFNTATHSLACGGNNTAASPQPIAGNVAGFQVRYLLQQSNGAVSPDPTIQYRTAAQLGSPDAPGWARVQAVEICLVLYGDEAIDMPAGSAYTNCDGKAIDMTVASPALPAAEVRRMHIAFRNVFQLRSQRLTSGGLVF
jgi:type IV pilus assembly protein PilW